MPRPPLSKPETPFAPAAEPVEKGTSLWKDAWRRLRRNHLALGGLIAFVAITLFCLIGPFFTGYTPEEQNLNLGASRPFATLVEIVDPANPQRITGFTTVRRLDPPDRPGSPEDLRIASSIRSGQTIESGGRLYRPANRSHVFGTDTLGRDLLTRVMHGGRVSLMVGFVATLVSLVIGVVYGATAAYLGGKVDATMMRIVDILYALPFVIFVILLMVLFGRSMFLLFVAIGAVEWLTMARIVRGQVMSLKKQEFVEAALALGYTAPRIIGRHLIPNVLGPIIVYATLTVPAVMLLESVLSFLGLGVQPPDASWGVLIKEGAESMTVFSWLLLFPALFFSVTLFSLNFLGDGLRDALDVRSSKD
jgi:oligopeptide transport system permease protein